MSEYSVSVASHGVRHLVGELVSFDAKSGAVFKYKKFGKAKRVQETIPTELIVFCKENKNPLKSELAYNSSGHTLFSEDKLEGVKAINGNLHKATTRNGEALYFSTQFANLTTLVSLNKSKKEKSSKTGKKTKSTKEKTNKKVKASGKVKTAKASGKIKKKSRKAK